MVKLKLNGYFQCVKLNGKAGANLSKPGDQPKPTKALVSSPSSIPGKLDTVKKVRKAFLLVLNLFLIV